MIRQPVHRMIAFFRPHSRFVLASLLLVMAACTPPSSGGDGADGSGESPSDAFVVVPVQVAPVVRTDLRRTVSGSTTLESAQQASVVSEIAGTLRALEVDRGDVVTRGQVVARIVNEDVRISIAEARDAVERQRNEVERLRPLFDQGYLARQTFEQAEFQLRSAETSLDRVRTQGGTQTVRAPIAGVVTARSVNVGEVVVPNQGVFEITVVDALQAVLAVPERELGVLREGLAAEITVEAFPTYLFPGEVTRIDPIVDPQTGTVEVRVDVSQPDGAPRLRPGMFTAVRVVTDTHEGALAVPKRAVIREAGEAYFFVLGDPIERPPSDGSGAVGPLDALQPYSVRRVTAEFGYEDRDLIEVMGGVDEGAQVVVVGQSGLDEVDPVVLPPRAGATGDE